MRANRCAQQRSQVGRSIILSPERASVIQTKLEDVLGRPIRSDEDIARDRQRKIDAKIEEARRHQEERLGNDMRVDIDSL